MILGIITFFRGVYKTLMGISIPLLVCMLVVSAMAVPTALKLAGLTHKLHVSEKAREKGERELATAESKLATCNANLSGVSAALESQNAAVDRLAAESEAATKRANEAIRKAQLQAAGLRGKIVRLERAKSGPDQCASARSLIVQTLGADR